jgi:hypothetical protein
MKNKTRRAGKLKRLYFPNSQPLGAGGYGIVFPTGPRTALKLLYDVEACEALRHEAILQQAATLALEGSPVHVPAVLSVSTDPIQVAGKWYLCGLEQERIPVLPEFGEPVHMLLGYDGDDIDTSWGRQTSRPVGPNNPSRGFFAGPEMLEAIWADEGINMKIEGVAYAMGLATKKLLAAGIIPNDLEWIYGGAGRIYLIDFGLCRFGHLTPEEYLARTGSESPAADIYLPQKSRGVREFLQGLL